MALKKLETEALGAMEEIAREDVLVVDGVGAMEELAKEDVLVVDGVGTHGACEGTILSTST